ncbi:MAG: ATP-binding protein, partial [Chloroflexi bacterium]
MRLKKINIKRFRSIENLEINDCGAFNVLIGKNNTGKSNILTAIQAFFSYITPDRIGTLASLNLIGKTVDFYGKAKTLSPIEIALTFLLTLTERDSLVQDIIADAPQMRNALEGIDPSLHMTITLTIKPPPPP